MLKTILMLSPLVIVAATACGNSEADFQGGNAAGSAGTAGAGGAAQGGADNKAGASSTGGANTSSTGGTKSGTAGTNTGGIGGAGESSSAAGSGGVDGLGGDTGAAGQGSENGGAGAGMGGAANEAPCPDIFGDYDIQSSEGTCGSFNDDAPQSIQGTTMACFAHFVSTPPNGAQAVNGGATLDADGNFEGSKLYLDDVQRNPCSGTWSAVDQTMTVKCGGQGDLCTVVLKKSP